MVCGLENSHKFHRNPLWDLPGAVPVGSMFSGAFRLVSSITLIGANALRAIGYCFSRNNDRVIDSLKAVNFNFFMSLYSIFEMVPVLGNFPSWLRLNRNDWGVYEQAMLGLIPVSQA
jgi:hypothetical protein